MQPYLDEGASVGGLRLGGCDQSAYGYGRAIGRQSETLDKRSSVTFLDLACSGALLTEDPRSDNTTLSQVLAAVGNGNKSERTYAGQIKAAEHLDKTIYQQVDALKELVGTRHVDAITISIGVNDLNWVGVLSSCALPLDCKRYLADDEDRLVASLPKLYRQLGKYVASTFPKKQLDPKDVFLVGYPDPLHETAAKLCKQYVLAFEGEKVRWAEDSIVKPLDRAEERNPNGWTVRGHAGRDLRRPRLLQQGQLVARRLRRGPSEEPPRRVPPGPAGARRDERPALPARQGIALFPNGTDARKPAG